MVRKLLIATVLAAGLPGVVSADPRQLLPGATLGDQVQFTSHGPVVIHVLTAPRPTGLWSLQPVLSNEAIPGTERLTAIEKRLSPGLTVAGVGGDLFNAQSGSPSGMLMRAGAIDHDPISTRSSIGVDAQGALHVDRVGLFGTWQGTGPRRTLNAVNDSASSNAVSLFTPAYGAATPPATGDVELVFPSFPAAAPNTELRAQVALVNQGGATPIPPQGAVLAARGTAGQKLLVEAPVGQTLKVRLILKPDWTGMVSALGGGPVLVRNGHAIFRANEAFTNPQLLPRAPRAAVGQLADGRIVIASVEGGVPGYSTGMTNFELAGAMVRLGAVTAAALGSGPQAAMAFDGQLVGRSADPAVADALLLGYAGVYAPEPLEPVLSPNGDGIAEKQSLAYRVVRSSDVSASLIGPDNVARYAFIGHVAPGTYPLDWPGTKPDGTPELEGTWRWLVNATDDLGRASTIERRFQLDLTLGFPKPFGGTLTIPRATARTVATFTLIHSATVTTRIETTSGVLLKMLDKRRLDPGQIAVGWDGIADSGALVYSGRYLAEVIATNEFGTVELASAFTVQRLLSPH